MPRWTILLRSRSKLPIACPPRSFDRTAQKLEAFIARHGRVRVLEFVNDFDGMDVKAFWHDLKFSLRH
jgi:hypothetical protein